MGDYFVWKGDLYGLVDHSVPDTAAWLTGATLKKKPKLVFQRSRAKPALADVVTIGFGVLLISAAARALLDEIGVKNLEFAPATIRGKGKEDTSYSVVNVLGTIDNCLDREHADWEGFAGEPDKVSSLYRYRLKNMPKTAPPVFRMAEFPWHTLAHKSVAKAFEASKLKGAKFVETEKYV